MQLLLSHLQNWLTLAHLRLTKKLSTMRICGHRKGVRISSPLRAILRRQSKDAYLRSFNFRQGKERKEAARKGALREAALYKLGYESGCGERERQDQGRREREVRYQDLRSEWTKLQGHGDR